MSTFVQGLRQTVRGLARRPGYACVAVLTLTLAIGATTAVFSVVRGVLLRALPYPGFEHLADVTVRIPPEEGRPARQRALDAASLAVLRDDARRLTGVAAYRSTEITLTGGGEPERLSAVRTTPNLFEVLGVAPAIGPGFADGAPGRDDVILSHGLWQRRFGADRAIVGRVVRLDGEPHTVVGVMPEDVDFPTRDVDVWLPRALGAGTAATATRISVEYLSAVARIEDGASPSAATTEAESLLRARGDGRRLSADLPAEARLTLRPLRDEMVADVRPALLAAFAAVALVLLIACVNLAHLLLARGTERRREMAVRSALGSSRRRLMGRVLGESLVLSTAGAAGALVLAGLLHAALPRLLPADLPRIQDVHLDGQVFVFALVVSVLSAVLFALLPALRAARTPVVTALRGDAGSRGGSGGGSPAPRRLLVVAEVALAVVVLVGAGLLVRSFVRLTAVDPGYRPGGVLAATLELPERYRAPGRGEQLFDRALERLRADPRVESAGAVAFPPLGERFAMVNVGVVGQPAERRLSIPQLTSPGYREAMGLEMRSGRWISDDDASSRAPVAVVNQTFASEYLGDGDPLGQRIELRGTRLRIVGVVGDVQLQGARGEPRAEVYVSYRLAEDVAGGGPQGLTLVARTSGDPLSAVPVLRQAVRQLDPDVPLQDVGPMAQRLAASVARPRFFALLLGGFAVIALLLACAGLYGVLAHAVARRTRAVGIRRALGADRRDVVARVMREGLAPVALGVGVGLLAAWAGARALASQLYEVAPRDPVTFVAAAAVLLVVAAAACAVPAWRAAQVDPAAALRHE